MCVCVCVCVYIYLQSVYTDLDAVVEMGKASQIRIIILKGN